MMRAVTVPTASGAGAEHLDFSPHPRPTARAGRVLIRVDAAGVNRADILQRKGVYPPPPGATDILGLECAGVVVDVGEGVDRSWLGRSVAALVEGGAYAEYCAASPDLLLDTEDRLSATAAAALPEALATTWMALFHLGGLSAGQSVLIQGGTGGIGNVAIQVARSLGCLVLATAGTKAKRAVVEKLGAHTSLDYNDRDLPAAVRRATDGNGVDAVLDNLGPSTLGATVQYLAPYGQILSIGSQAGRVGEINAGVLMSGQVTLRFASLRKTPAAVKAKIMSAVRTHLWPGVLEREIAPLVDSAFPMTDAARAHHAMEAGGHMGKIVLTRPGEQGSDIGVHSLSPYLTSRGSHA